MLLLLNFLFQTEGALAMRVARNTGYVTRCPLGDSELLRGDLTDDRRLTPLVRGAEKRRSIHLILDQSVLIMATGLHGMKIIISAAVRAISFVPSSCSAGAPLWICCSNTPSG
jgi:hypothetical protein